VVVGLKGGLQPLALRRIAIGCAVYIEAISTMSNIILLMILLNKSKLCFLPLMMKFYEFILDKRAAIKDPYSK